MLKLAKKLGLESADRMRTPRETTVAAVLSLSLLMTTAFVAADVRIHKGFHSEMPPLPLYDDIAA